MYGYPTRFPESTNREDLVRTISIFDDDTGDPIDLARVTRAVPGNFTNNLWLVTDGAIATISQSILVIPDYPIGSELLSVSLVVDPNLNILPGDLVTIADLPGGTAIVGPTGPPAIPIIGEDGFTLLITEDSGGGESGGAGNLTGGPNTMTGYVLSYTASTGALVVQISLAFQLEIRHIDQQHRRGSDYSMWYDWGGGAPTGEAPLIVATLGSGLTIIDMGFLQIDIPALTMQQLHHRSYSIALAMSDSINTRTIFLGRLPVLYGGTGVVMPSSSIVSTTVQFTP